MNLALIPDWLRLAHFAVPGTPLAILDFGLRILVGLTVTPISLATRQSPLATPSSLATACVN